MGKSRTRINVIMTLQLLANFAVVTVFGKGIAIVIVITRYYVYARYLQLYA
jgi:hypothetical protein